MLALCLFFVASAFLVWMFFIEPRLIQLNRYSVTLKKKVHAPLTILHLSDTHFSGNDKTLSRFFERLGAESVDFVFVTGDMIDWDGGMSSCIENFLKLRPRFGTFVVFGNHDYYDYHLDDVVVHNFPGQSKPFRPNRTDLFRSRLEAAGIHVLVNDTVEIKTESGAVLIHGLDDPTTGRADLVKAMKNFNPAQINILLTHTVDAFLDIGEGEIDLSFSGHSHGGQICLPWIGPVITHTSLGRPYAAGIFNLKGAVCCVSRGMNASRFLWPRFLCPPEAILLTLQ